MDQGLKVDRKILRISSKGTHMQISLKTVAASVALAFIATPALAVESTTSGNSSLFITVFDPVLGASVVQDLGINYADFLRPAVTPNTGYVANFNVDLSVFQQVGSNVANLQYSLFAGDATGNYTATEVLASAALGSTVTGINSNVVGMLGSSGAANVFASWNTNCGTTSVTCTGTGFSSTYFGNFADDMGGFLSGAAGNIGSALGFYSLRRSSPGAGDPLVATTYANANGLATWVLNLDGTLTYTAPTVPLPAAVWLLLSGLAGMGVISRRKAR